MLPVSENPRGTANMNMENLFAHIFGSKKRIVEMVKQKVGLFDQHLACKCLLAGVSPPSWLRSPYLPSQTSELNKEEIISGLLYPQSRHCNQSFPSPEHSQNQRAETNLEATSHGRSQGKLVPKSISTTGCERKPSSPVYLQDETEPNLESAFPLAKIQRSKSRQKALELRSSAKASKSRSNSRNELKPSPGGNIGLEIDFLRSSSTARGNRSKTEHSGSEESSSAGVEPRHSISLLKCGDVKESLIPSTIDVEDLVVENIASDDQSKEKGECVDTYRCSSAGRVSQTGISSEDLVAEVVKELLVPSTIDVEGLVVDGQSKENGECVDTYTCSSAGRVSQTGISIEDLVAEGVKESLIPSTIDVEGLVVDDQSKENGECVNTYRCSSAGRISQTGISSEDLVAECVKEPLIPSTIDVEGLVVDDQSKENGECVDTNRCSSTGRVSQTGISSEDLVAEGVKESLIPSTIDVEGLVVDDQSKENGECVDTNRCSSAGRVSQTGISSEDLVAECVKESLIPSTIDVEGLVVDDQSKENGECVDTNRCSSAGRVSQTGISSEDLVVECLKESLIPSTIDVEGLVADDQSKENGECVDTNRCSSAGRVSQTGIFSDEATMAGAIQDSLPTIELLGFVESSSVEVRLRHSVMQSDDESVLLRPVTVTGEALLVEEDNAGESTEISSIPKSRSLSQTDITEVEPVVVESILQANGTVEDLIDHSKKCDTSCGSKEVQPETQGSLTRAGGNQCHERLSRPRSSANEEESTNELKALSVGSDHIPADKHHEVRAGNSSLRTHDLPVFVKPESPRFDDNEEANFNEIPMNSREKSSMEKAATPASAAMVLDVPSLTDSEVILSEDIEDHNGLKKEMVSEMESPAIHTSFKMGDNEPPESNTFTGHIDALTKRLQLETSSDSCIPPINRNIACTETGESYCPESFVHEFFCSSSSMEGSKLQNKRRRTLETLTSRVPSSSPGEDILSDSVRETVHHREEVECHNLNHYDVELQKIIGSAPSDHYDVELQKMIGSASSAELQFEEGYLFKEAGLMSPPNQGFKTENMDILPFAGETSHPFASRIVRDSDCSPCLSPLGLIGSVDGSPPVLEGFIIHTDDENPSSSKNQIKHDSFQLPRTAAESATMIEQIRKSACKTTPSLHLAKTFKFNGKLDLDQSVSTELLDGMFFSQNLEGSSVFDNLGINLDYTGRFYTDCLPLSGAGSSTDARNPRASPTEKLWYRSLQKPSSSEKRGSQTPDLPCITEENENVDEEAESLCTNTPKSMSLEQRGSSVLDLPCIAEENENLDEMSEAVNEASDSERGNVSAERKPLADISQDPIQFLPSVSEANIPVDRQSLDSVNTAFSFSASCNNSVKSKVGRQNGGSRRFTGKDKDNQVGAGAGRNVRPPSSRFSKAKLSCNSSLSTLRPRLPEKEPRYNNIVSNITSFVPLVQQQKPAAALLTGKRDVKVKALEAAEASKRIAEQKENDRKMKKEAMKLERARLEEENLRKQEMEKKKKEEERKKKEAEMACKQEMEKKKKEEERKRKEFEVANRKRQREEEKKMKEAKRQRVAEIQRQQREAEKELKRQAMDAKIKALKELKETQSNAEKTRGQANTRIPEVRSKSHSSNDRDDDFKVISNPGKMSEESYDISPYKCSDDENEEEDDYDDMSNHKFVPSWASKSNILHTVISQQKRDPDFTFPAKSFRDITQILLPRKFRWQ